MKSRSLSRLALSTCAGGAILTGCGGSQPRIGAPGATVQRSAVLTATVHRQDLLYVSSDVATNVYTYPNGKLFSALGGSTGVICSNAAGDVFLSQVNVDFVDEFQHGRSTPIAQLSFSGQSCSVDTTSGELAVASFTGDGVGIFRPTKRHHRWHLPRLYQLPGYLFSCAYDASGDLFVDGQTQNDQIFLAELAKGKSKFKNVTLDYNLSTLGTVQWDGQYLAVGDEGNTLIRRFSFQGFKGTQVGSLTLSGPSSLAQFWIDGSIVIGADSDDSQVDFWNYPDGGSEIKELNVDQPLGVTVSSLSE